MANPLLHFFFGHTKVSQSVKCESSLISPNGSRRLYYTQKASWNVRDERKTNSFCRTSKLRSEFAQHGAICVRIAVEDEHFLKRQYFSGKKIFSHMNRLVVSNGYDGLRCHPMREDLSWACIVRRGLQVCRPTVLFPPSI